MVQHLKRGAKRVRRRVRRCILAVQFEDVPPDPRAALGAPGLTRACQRVADLAHGYFRDAHAAMRRCDRRAMKPARLMGATYAALLARIERRGWDQPAERVSLPNWQKLWLALRYGLA
jgi:phytoene synthase